MFIGAENMDYPLPLSEKSNELYLHNCRLCGTELHRENKRYCNQEHAAMWRDTVLWEDAFWLQKKVAIKRDKHTCQQCGIKEDWKFYKESLRNVSNLHIHHIIPRCMGGSNKIDNLITLCEECHKEEHARLRLPLGS
jgi:5-methylcytosine-specific restriction endonuclease McrA